MLRLLVFLLLALVVVRLVRRVLLSQSARRTPLSRPSEPSEKQATVLDVRDIPKP